MNALLASQRRPPSILAIIEGPAIAIFGGELNAIGLPSPIPCNSESLFAPRAVCYHPLDDSLWVSDTGHHRVLAWRNPHSGMAAADLIMGQGTGEGRNRGGDPDADSFNVPCGITAYGQGIAVADSWNHRVLIWLNLPWHQQAPDIVLGQDDFKAAQANREHASAAADTLYWPSGVVADGERLYVADTGNRRVLIWDQLPKASGVAADRVLGQQDFQCRDENAGATPSKNSMRWPHALCFWQGRLCVADAGNNRVMVYPTALPPSHSACQFLLGQENSQDSLHNCGTSAPSANSLSMPYGIGSSGEWLVVADTANSRLLAWHIDALHDGAPAKAILGQRDFNLSGDNAWGPVTDTSICWPYGLHIQHNSIAIADTGNSRILLYRMRV